MFLELGASYARLEWHLYTITAGLLEKVCVQTDKHTSYSVLMSIHMFTFQNFHVKLW